MRAQILTHPAKLRSDIEQLANMACGLDELKNGMPSGEGREQLCRAVDEMHSVAQFFDRLHEFGIYAREGA